MYTTRINVVPWTPIVLCDKWSESKYGTTSSEASNLKLINYIETKYLVHEIFDTVDEWNDHIMENRNFLLHEQKSYRYMLLKHVYCFVSRYFVSRHYGIVKFQRLWRLYYNNKLRRSKNIKQILMRQITGKKIK